MMLAPAFASTAPATQATSFNITAISAANNASRLECWQLEARPTWGRGAVNFDLGDFENAFVGILPPNTTTGTINNAVQVQYSLTMAGLIHIRTPYSGLPDYLNEVWVQGGRHGWVIAADLLEFAAQGHITTFPGTEKTVIAEFPVAGNKPPAHEVLHVGPCTSEDLAGL
ncbi:hypothetical protein ACEQ8H_000967 [Pleosporales sp. CAS-2024a]